VIAFFVISGFLITRLSIRRWERLPDLNVARFYRLRAARILPCLILLLLVLGVLHLAGAAPFVIAPERASLGEALGAALTFHINWLEGHRGYLPGSWDILWSLSVEEVFYLSFPLVCLLLRREALLLVPLAGLIAIGPISRTMLAGQEPWAEYAYLSCMDGIAFGCLAALAAARLQFRRRTLRAALVAGAAIAAAVGLFCNEDSRAGLARYGLNVTLLEAGVALMLLALGRGVGARLLSRGTGWLRVVGRGSYEVYLFHMLIVLSLMQAFKYLKPPIALIPAWYLAMLSLSLLLGLAIARFFSEPMNRWLRGGGRGGREAGSGPIREPGD